MGLRGGMTARSFQIKFTGGLHLSTFSMISREVRPILDSVNQPYWTSVALPLRKVTFKSL